MAITKEILSGSTNGRGILLVDTATPGTLLHTADAIAKDEVWIYVQNNHTAAVSVTIEFGGVTSPNDLIRGSIQSQSGLFLFIPGIPVIGGVSIRAFASLANVVSCFGYVNRIS